MIMSNIKAVIFDYDGVIVDSVKVIYEVNQKVMRQMGFRPFLNFEEFSKIFRDWRGYYQSLDPGNPHIVNGLIKNFKAELEKSLQDVVIFNGIDNVIKKLSETYKLGIVSHNLREIIESKLKEHNLIGYFSSIVDGRVENIKPHPEPLLICMSELGVQASEACFIGDLTEDFQAARNARLAKFIAVMYGGYNYGEIEGADAYVKNPEEIIGAVESP